MSFSRLFPAGVPTNFTLRGAIGLQADIDHANALDKTGDTTTGSITIGNNKTLFVGDGVSPATIEVRANSAMQTDVGGTMNIDGTMNVGDGINPATLELKAGGGPKLVFDVGSFGTINGVLTTQSIAGNPAQLKTSAGGRFQHGDTDYMTLGGGHPAASSVRRLPLGPLVSNAGGFAGWGTLVDFGLSGPATTQTVLLALPLGPGIWNGATISSMKLLFTPNTTHSALPAVNITATLQYFTPNVGGVATSLGTLGSAGIYSPVSLVDYNSGITHALTIPCGSVLIDTTANCYVLSLTDENGANAKAGGRFHALEFTYTLSDLRPC